MPTWAFVLQVPHSFCEMSKFWCDLHHLSESDGRCGGCSLHLLYLVWYHASRLYVFRRSTSIARAVRTKSTVSPRALRRTIHELSDRPVIKRHMLSFFIFSSQFQFFPFLETSRWSIGTNPSLSPCMPYILERECDRHIRTASTTIKNSSNLFLATQIFILSTAEKRYLYFADKISI